MAALCLLALSHYVVASCTKAFWCLGNGDPTSRALVLCRGYNFKMYRLRAIRLCTNAHGRTSEVRATSGSKDLKKGSLSWTSAL